MDRSCEATPADGATAREPGGDGGERSEPGRSPGQARRYEVPGISCDHCKHAIESEVGAVPGVRTVEVDIAAKRVLVLGDADDAAIRAAIDEAGYEIASATP